MAGTDLRSNTQTEPHVTRLEHIGIAVSDPTRVRSLLSELLGLEAYKIETVESERIDTHFIGADGVKLELLETHDADSVIGRFLERRGGGIHHLAFEVERLETVLERASRLGLKPVNAEPKEGADGKRVFFLHPKETYGILIEICESDRFTGSKLTVPVPHGDVTVFRAGSEESFPILLFHDAGSSSLRDFAGVMALLEPYVQVLAFDAPGHGESSGRSPDSHFLQGAGKQALAVLDHLEIDEAVVAGTGVGAAAAAAVAVQDGSRVRGLAFIDPNFLTTDEEIASATRRAEEASGDAIPELASHLKETMHAAAESAVSMEMVRDVSCPCLVCSMRPSDRGRTLRLQEDLPDASLAVVSEFEDRNRALAHILVGFVRSAGS